MIEKRSRMSFNINITKRERRRKLKSGTTVAQTRYVVQWRDPKTGEREQRFFERKKDAEEKRSDLIVTFERGTYSSVQRHITIAEAVEAWLDTKRGTIRANTLASYEFVGRYITGPLMAGENRKKRMQSGLGVSPKDATTLECLGKIKVNELTTRQIRNWHKQITDEVSLYTANKAKQFLKAALHLAAEEYDFRPPAMPTGLQRMKDKPRKVVLSPEHVARLIEHARDDHEKGVYYAFPFLAGTRPSEQLGLLWEAVDFEKNVIHIHRVQDRLGKEFEMTKTASGTRSIPMSPLLREMLLAWRVRCPRQDGNLHRVFPQLGVRQKWPLPRLSSGGSLIYNNFRTRIWKPVLKKLNLPEVTPHSARHAFISTLQAQGIEVGLVAKLAGHKNAVITLSHYTHAMRGGEEAVAALDRAYSIA